MSKHAGKEIKKGQKPKLQRKETIENLILLNNEQSRLFLECMENGTTDQVKNSTDPYAKKILQHIVAMKSYDKLFIEKGVDEDDLTLSTQFHNADSEPDYINTTTENEIKIKMKRIELDSSSMKSSQVTSK